MKNLMNLMVYILKKYPKIEELSLPRFLNLLYLIDWKCIVDNNVKFTEANWQLHHYGPYSQEIIQLFKDNPTVFKSKVISENAYRLSVDKEIDSNFPNEIKSAADFIIENTFRLPWSDFISLVYSTYPVKHNGKFSYIDLMSDAIAFKRSNQNNTFYKAYTTY